MPSFGPGLVRASACGVARSGPVSLVATGWTVIGRLRPFVVAGEAGEAVGEGAGCPDERALLLGCGGSRAATAPKGPGANGVTLAGFG